MVLSHLRHDIEVSSKKNTGISEATGSEMSPITPPLVHFNRTSGRVLISITNSLYSAKILSVQSFRELTDGHRSDFVQKRYLELVLTRVAHLGRSNLLKDFAKNSFLS